jgi:hypothetical protein
LDGRRGLSSAVVRQQSFFPPQSALRQGRSASAFAPAFLVRPASIELFKPLVEIGLQLFDRAIELFSERNAVELVQHGLVEPLHDAVGLRAFSRRERRLAVFLAPRDPLRLPHWDGAALVFLHGLRALAFVPLAD